MHRSHSSAIVLRMFATGLIVYSANATAADQRTYATTGAAVTIDGIPAISTKSVSGGSAVGITVVETVTASGNFRRKHLAGLKYEDLSIGVVGVPNAAVTAWLNQSLAGTRAEKGGYVSLLDAQMNETSRLTWYQALVSKIELPELEAGSKNAGEFKLTLSPQRTVRSGTGGKATSTAAGTKQKVFTTNNFRIVIDGLDLTTVNHVEPLSIRLKSVTNAVGEMRDYEKTPGTADVSNLVFTIDRAHAATLQAWYDAFVIKGESGQDKERSGRIEYLAADMNTVLFTVSMSGLGLVSLDAEPTEAGRENVQRLRAEIYIESVTLSAPKG